MSVTSRLEQGRTDVLIVGAGPVGLAASIELGRRGGVALIRPDQHVAWRGDAMPQNPDDVLARVTGRIMGQTEA